MSQLQEEGTMHVVIGGMDPCSPRIRAMGSCFRASVTDSLEDNLH